MARSTDIAALLSYATRLRAEINAVGVPSGMVVEDEVRWYAAMLRRERDAVVARIRELR